MPLAQGTAMQASFLRRHRPLATLLVATILVAAAGVLAARAASGPSYEKRGSVHCVEEKGYLYTFDAVWRVETLRRIDPATGVAERIASPDAALLAHLRSALLGELKVGRLEKIPAEGEAEVAAIRALGYI